MNKAKTTRPGMTLVELMVVIAIIVILLAMTGPIFKPQLKGRALREAARQFNSYIAVAKAKAAETGRPHGICIVRSPLDASASLEVCVMETPMPYAGADISGAGSLAQLIDGGGGFANSVSFQDGYGLVNDKDLIQFNFQGPLYQLNGTASPYGLQPVDMTNPRYPRPGDVRFKVFRRAVKSTFRPLQLPAKTVIDLGQSGIGDQDGSSLAPGDITIMFTPTGTVDYSRNLASPRGTIYFMIGRPDQIGPIKQPDIAKQNLNDPTAIWVSIGDMTGSVTTADNYVASVPTNIISARQLARDKTNSGGR